MLNLIVIRSPDIERAVKFYEVLAIEFILHSHGKGPMHYASQNIDVTFEIYPTQGELSSTKDVRLGFTVDKLDETIEQLLELGAELVSKAKDSPWGRRAVCKDLDGHTVEITQRTG